MTVKETVKYPSFGLLLKIVRFIMRFLLIAASILFALEGFPQGEPPTRLKGWAQPSFLISNDVVVPFKQATRLAGTRAMIETGNKNLLENPSFNHSTITTGWTASDITTGTNTTSPDGRAVSLTATANDATFCQEYTFPGSTEWEGLPAKISILAKSDDDSAEICEMRNGSEDTCVPIEGDIWTEYRIPTFMPDTSFGVCIKIGDSGDSAVIDDVFVGLGDGSVESVVSRSAVIDLTGSGDFTEGEVLVTRVGRQVTVSTVSNLIHSSADTVESTVGVLPSWARPLENKTNVVIFGSAFILEYRARANGSIGCSYRDWAGGFTSRSNCTVDGTISYSVQDELSTVNVIQTQKAQRCEVIDVSSDANFTAGEFKVCRDQMGRVTIQRDLSLANITFSNTTSVLSDGAVIPEWAAPAGVTRNAYQATDDAGGLRTIRVGEDRKIGFQFGGNRTSSADFTITYLAADAETSQATILGNFKANSIDGGIEVEEGKKFVMGHAVFAGGDIATNCTSSPCLRYVPIGIGSEMTLNRVGTGNYRLVMSNLKPNSLVFCNCHTSNTESACSVRSQTPPSSLSIITDGSGDVEIDIYSRSVSDGALSDRRVVIQCFTEAP